MWPMITGPAELRGYPFSAASPLDAPVEFAHLRANEPVSRVRLERGEVAWLLTRYADIRAALIDSRLTTWVPGVSAGAVEEAPGLLFVMNGPAHLRLRGRLSKGLTPRLVEDLRPRIRQIADQLVAAMIQEGHPADLIPAFAASLSIAALSELLGIPIGQREGFREWSDAMLAVFSAPTPAEMAAGGTKLAAFVAELLADKRRQPGDDLLSALVAPGDVCDRLSDSELQNIVFTLLLAAYVPPANAMAVAVLQLFRHPDQHAVLRANPALIGTAVDELLRIDQSSAADQLRVATADVDIGGVPIRAGGIVVAPLRCANQDPAVFVDADRFDVTRAENPHLTFAYGPHYCLGAALARLQLQVGIGVLVGRLPQLRLAVPFAELSWTPMFFTLNGPQTLPVVW